MALEDPVITRNYENRKVLYAENLDASLDDVESLLSAINNNFTQLRKDLFLSTYNYGNNGTPILSKSLQQEINELKSGATPITGTSAESFVINSDNTSSASVFLSIRNASFDWRFHVDSNNVASIQDGAAALSYLTFIGTTAPFSVVVNNGSLGTIDFLVKSDNYNAFFVDSSADTASIGVPLTVNAAAAIKATTAVDSSFEIRPFTSGQSFFTKVPATGNRATFYLGTSPLIDLHYTSLAVVINEDGLASDFRVETGSNSQAFVVSSGDNAALFGVTLEVFNDANIYGVLTIEALAGDTDFFIRPATSGNELSITVPATGNRATFNIGTNPYIDLFGSGGNRIVFNEDGIDMDIRMETLNVTDAFALDGGTDTGEFNVQMTFNASVILGSAASLTFGVGGTASLNQDTTITCGGITVDGPITISDSVAIAFSFVGLDISGEATGTGTATGLSFTTSGGTLDYIMAISNTYLAGGGAGSYYDRVLVNIVGVGAKYIHLFNA